MTECSGGCKLARRLPWDWKPPSFSINFIPRKMLHKSRIIKLVLLGRRSQRSVQIFFQSARYHALHIFMFFFQLYQLFTRLLNQIFIRLQLLLKCHFLCLRLLQSLYQLYNPHSLNFSLLLQAPVCL